jgi:hypothetical protein
MTFQTHSTQFENIGKIGIELDRQNKVDSCEPIVMDPKSLVARFIPQNFRTIDVYRSPWDYYLAVAPDVGVSSVYSKNGVVLSDRRAKQQRPILSELQSQPGQKSRVLVIQSEFACAKRLDIAKSIENREHVSLF